MERKRQRRAASSGEGDAGEGLPYGEAKILSQPAPFVQAADKELRRARLVAWSQTLPQARPHHTRLLHSHPFNFRVQAVFPRGASDPFTDPVAALSDEGSAFGVRGPLVGLLAPEFLTRYVTSRDVSFCAITHKRPIDSGFVAAITPDGKLLLCVDNDVRETLGLVAKRSSLRVLRNERYNISIDLRSKGFQPGHPEYDRVRWCLSEALDATLRDVDLLAFAVNANRMVPVSFPSEFRVTPLPLGPARRTLSQVCTPKWGDLEADELSTVYDYLGLLLCDASEVLAWPARGTNLGDDAPPLEISWEATGQDVEILTWEGLVPAEVVAEVSQRVRDAVDEETLPWAFVHVTGFEDAPVSFGSAEHGHLVSGENDYTLLHLPGHHVVSYAAIGPLDACPL